MSGSGDWGRSGCVHRLSRSRCRYHDLGRLRRQLLYRLHAELCELVPGGFAKELTAGQAIDVLAGVVAESPVLQAKLELARELVTDLQRLDAWRRDARRCTARAVAASGTSITDIRGVGPIIASAVLGYVRDIQRFANRDHFASYSGTAPIEVSCRRPEDLPAVPARQPATQPRRRGQERA